jgi:hypothetical protein
MLGVQGEDAVMNAIPVGCLVCLSSVMIPDAAQATDFELDQSQSLASQSLVIDVPFSGTLIGDYDEETNPEGTQSRPGLFGGSGNNPIDYSAQFDMSGDNSSSPSGTMSITIDEKMLTAVVNDVSIDLLGGAVNELEYGVTFIYDTFHTVSPFSIYPGGIEIPIPLGSAQVTSSQMESTLPGGLLLEPLKSGGYAVSGVLNAETTSSVELGTGPLEFTVPVILPVSGTLQQGEGGWEIELSISLSVDEDVPIEDVPPFEGVPLPLPTIPPSGSTANMLMSGELSAFSIQSEQSLLLVAHEVESSNPADLNGDGIVNGADMGLLFLAWGLNPGNPADINQDDWVDGGDLGLLILYWTG